MRLVALALAATSLLAPARAACSPSYTLCAPAGARATALPPVGTALAGLYPALLDAVKDIHAPPSPPSKRDTSKRSTPHKRSTNTRTSRRRTRLAARDAPSICCAAGSACLLLAAPFGVPLCYDRFTTNFLLPDGGCGALDDGGTYRAADGSVAFLANGSFAAAPAKSTGNLYGDVAEAPDAATLPPAPTPYTGTGVGSAIPVTALGGRATYTTTVLVPVTTVPPSTVGGSVVEGTTKSAATAVVTTAVAGAGSGGFGANWAARVPVPASAGAVAGLVGVVLVVMAAL